MIRCFRIVLFLCVSAAITCNAMAEVRTWTSASGKVIAEAEMIELKGMFVFLKKADGKITFMPLDRLSKADQIFVKQEVANANKMSSNDAGGKAKIKRGKTDDNAKADKKTDIDTPKKGEKPKVGAFHIDRGVTGGYYLDAAACYQSPSIEKIGGPKPEVIANMRSNPKSVINFEHDGKLGFEVYVPEDYSPSKAYGIISFVSAGDGGGVPGGFKNVLKKHHLIWIGGNGIGNDADVPFRHAKAIMAVTLIVERYSIDPDRIYVSGNSGGGRLASQAMIANPNIFAGGIPMIGCNHHSFVFGLPPATLATAKRQGRYAFITGDKDFNKESTKSVFDGYQREGFACVSYFQVPGMGHSMPPSEWFEKALLAVDEPLKLNLKKQYDSALRAEKSKRYGEAALGFLRAAMHDESQPFSADAKEQFAKIRTMFDEDQEKVETAIDNGKYADATKYLNKFKLRWASYGSMNANQLAERLLAAKRAKRN